MRNSLIILSLFLLGCTQIETQTYTEEEYAQIQDEIDYWFWNFLIK